VVTAERRAESIQDVPITIQALTSETLTQLNVRTFDDFVKYLPNVTAGSIGPGQSNVFIRGLATSIGGLQGVGATGSFPNVATYLDDQSGPAGRLHGSLSRSQHHAAAGLHQLLARPVRGLLPVRLSRLPVRGRQSYDGERRKYSGVLLLPERLLDRQPERHAPEPRNTPEHAERLAH